MNSAAIRLRGSSALPFLAAARCSACRVASAASGGLRCTIRRTARAGSVPPTAAERFTSWGLARKNRRAGGGGPRAAAGGGGFPLGGVGSGGWDLKIADRANGRVARLAHWRRFPPRPQEKAGLPAALGAEPPQYRGPGVVA